MNNVTSSGKVYVLYHGRYNSIDKQVISVNLTIEGAKKRAEQIVIEDECSGLGGYAEGPGISYTADSGVLYRGQRENPYCLWAVEMELSN
jgi:hypothetical protein